MAKFNQIATTAEQVWKEVIGEKLPNGEAVSMKNIVAVGNTILSSSTTTEQFYKVLKKNLLTATNRSDKLYQTQLYYL